MSSPISSTFKYGAGRMLCQNGVALLLLMVVPLAHPSCALRLPSERFAGIPLGLVSSNKSGLQRTSQSHLRMADEQFYSPRISKGEPMNHDGYYNRGQSPLARLAQQSQTRQKVNPAADLQSTLKNELDMMEEKLLQFQETSIRRSHEMLNRLELFSRGGRSNREQGQRRIHDASFASSDGPFIGTFVNDVEGGLLQIILR